MRTNLYANTDQDAADQLVDIHGGVVDYRLLFCC